MSEDIWKEREALWQAFDEAYQSYDDAPKELHRLAEAYEACDPTIQGVINWVTSAVTGLAIPTLMEIARRGTSKNIEDWHGWDTAPFVHPPMAIGVKRAPETASPWLVKNGSTVSLSD